MSWKLRNAGWNKGMKRYQKKGGGYGYYDPNSNGTEYFILGVILLIVGLFSIPLDVMPLPPILIIGGVGLIYGQFYESEEEKKSRKYIEKLEKRLGIEHKRTQESLELQNERKKFDDQKRKIKVKDLKKMYQPTIKKKLIEWSKTEEMKKYSKDIKKALENSDPYFLKDTLLMKWNNFVLSQGYKPDDI